MEGERNNMVAVTDISRSGVAPPAETAVDVANGNTIPNDGRTVLLVRNANASTVRNLTVYLVGAIDGQAVTPRTYAIPVSSSRYIGPFGTADYGTDLSVNGDNTDLKLVVLRVPS